MDSNTELAYEVCEGVPALNTTEGLFLSELWLRAERSENGWITTVSDMEVKPGDLEAYQSLERQGFISVQKSYIGNAWDENRPFTLKIDLLNPAYKYRPSEQERAPKAGSPSPESTKSGDDNSKTQESVKSTSDVQLPLKACRQITIKGKHFDVRNGDVLKLLLATPESLELAIPKYIAQIPSGTPRDRKAIRLFLLDLVLLRGSDLTEGTRNAVLAGVDACIQGNPPPEGTTVQPEALTKVGSDVGNVCVYEDRAEVVAACRMVSSSSVDPVPELPTTEGCDCFVLKPIVLKVPPNGLDGDG